MRLSLGAFYLLVLAAIASADGDSVKKKKEEEAVGKVENEKEVSKSSEEVDVSKLKKEHRDEFISRPRRI